MAAIQTAGMQMPDYKPGHSALRKGRVSIPSQIYFVTTTTHERVPHFADFQVARSASACFENPRLLRDTTMLAWVLMPDHVHWLLQLGCELQLSDAVRRLKSASAHRINSLHGSHLSVWDKGFHDSALRKETDIRAAARYLVANPLRAGLVNRIGDYPFWDAVWL